MNWKSWLLIISLGVAGSGLWADLWAAQRVATQANSELFVQAEQAMVIVLVGDGAGRVLTAEAGVMVGSDGVVLAAYHPLKDGQEVQVRLRSGEVYDQVQLVGFDERRDVAALRLPASGLVFLAGTGLEQAMPGDRVRVLEADATLAWSSADGALGPARMADEIPGAGRGFRVMPFAAHVSSGSLGGALVDSQGSLLGFIPSSPKAGEQPYAIPWASVAGLPAQGLHVSLGNGRNLTPPRRFPNFETAAEPLLPATALAQARSLRVTSTTSFFTPFMLEKELLDNDQFRSLGLNVVNGFKGGDLLVSVGRPLFTYDFTYSVSDSRSGIIVATGKVTAVDGPHAAKGISQRLVAELESARGMQAAPINSQGSLPSRP